MKKHAIVTRRHRECRIAVVLDLENLLHGHRAAGDWGNAVEAVAGALRDLRRRGTLVAAVAVCDASMARLVCVPLAVLGVRVFAHNGGPQTADIALLERLEHDVPASCDVVVIGSGDHVFTGAALRLRALGKRVEMLAVPGTDSLALRLSVDGCVRLA